MVMLRFRHSEMLVLQGISNAVREGVILHTYVLENGFLLRNISKMYCQSAKICYNKGVATFWQQKISKPE